MCGSLWYQHVLCSTCFNCDLDIKAVMLSLFMKLSESGNSPCILEDALLADSNAHVAGGQLCPPSEELLTQQGGSLVFRGQEVIFRHADSGILKYTNMDAFVAAATAL